MGACAGSQDKPKCSKPTAKGLEKGAETQDSSGHTPAQQQKYKQAPHTNGRQQNGQQGGVKNKKMDPKYTLPDDLPVDSFNAKKGKAVK